MHTYALIYRKPEVSERDIKNIYLEAEVYEQQRPHLP